MRKAKNFYFRNNWKILALLVLLINSFSLVDFFYNKITFANAESICADGTGTLPLPNTTFLKSYRPLVFTKINSAWPTKDGGYIVSGTTDPNIMFIPPDGFVAKLDKQGSVQWMKLLKTTNAVGGNIRGDEDVQSVIELKNGGYLMAAKVWGFIKAADWKADDLELNKILFTKLDKKGNVVWSNSFTAFVEDAKNSLLETDDGGFLFHANMLDLTPNKRGEDSDVYQDMPFASLKVLKLDQAGKLQWSKNIKNFIARDNDSYFTQSSDGGYVLAGNIAETNPAKELPYNFDKYPGLAKFDKDFNFEWAKSMESTPLDMATAIPKVSGGFEMGWKKVRQGALVVHGMVRTQDDGYLVLGNFTGLSLMTDTFDIKSGAKSWLVGFKFNSAGNLEWVKKMTFGFNEFTVPLSDFSVILTKDGNMLLAGPFNWAVDDFKMKLQTKTATNAFRPGIFMMKMDQELNTSWAKIVNPQRGATNYVLKPTLDSGAIIAGEYETNVVKSVLFGMPIYYKDGFLMKIDASGNIKNNKKWMIDYAGNFVTELLTPYTVSNNLVVQVDPMEIILTKRKPEFSLYKKAKTTAYAPFTSAKQTLCPLAPSVVVHDVPLQNSISTSTATRTWPQINYERKVPVEPINDKSRNIHNELLPILNQLYNNQVKLTDNMGGSMLSYIFDRTITKDDMTAVKNYLGGLGYKVQDEGVYQLTMYKVGYFLNLTFSVNNLSKAFLDVTY